MHLFIDYAFITRDSIHLPLALVGVTFEQVRNRHSEKKVEYAISKKLLFFQNVRLSLDVVQSKSFLMYC